MSSDALLMNIFCCPGVTKTRNVTLLLGTDLKDIPEFGFRPRVPLLNGAKERTEVDMKLGSVPFEAKLTEGDFQIQDSSTVEQYRDFREVFDCSQLPRRSRDYVSYQLLLNVLAAHALNLQFCVLLDARRPDLFEQWYRIIRCVRSADRSDQMQGPDVARTCVLPAGGTPTVSEYQIWNPLQAFLSDRFG